MPPFLHRNRDSPFVIFNSNKVTHCLSCLQYSRMKKVSNLGFVFFFLCVFSLFSFLVTADKINKLSNTVPPACWMSVGFCCAFEAWRQIKGRQILSSQRYCYCIIHHIFSITLQHCPGHLIGYTEPFFLSTAHAA